ncbi:MAG: aspartate ammonia-lyase [Thermodesulfobacteriota bacterium]
MAEKGFRTEEDTLGPIKVPAQAYYGAQTMRAAQNFPVSAIRAEEVFIRATAMVKKAAASANTGLGLLTRRKGAAIMRAASEVISEKEKGTGRLLDQFIVDVYQAGAGTSHNMNANEVIANRAIEILRGGRGDYSIIHPNDDVNMSQSTNDTFPTSMRVAALLSSAGLLKALKGLKMELNRKARKFNSIIKSGRTHLQDAVPVSLGSDFASYASTIDSSMARIKRASEGLKRIGLGGTATGTGLNTHPSYRQRVVRELSKISAIKGLKKAPDRGAAFEALSSMSDFSSFSASLKDLAIDLTKIANDLRLLSSGPRTGLSEIRLPAVQPGSSIMPGKVNPVMAEMLNMVCFQVIGNDLAVTMAAQAGQFELNVMGPVINYNILQSIKILTNAISAFSEKCVKGIEADRKRCEQYFESSVGLATVLNPFIGYEKAAGVAKESATTGKTIKEVVIEKGIMGEKEWKRLLAPKRVTGPMDIKAVKKKGR